MKNLELSSISNETDGLMDGLTDGWASINISTYHMDKYMYEHLAFVLDLWIVDIL